MTRTAPRPPTAALAAAAWLFVAAAIVAYTVGKAHVQVADLWDTAAQSQREVRLTPFAEFSDPPVWYGPWVNLIGNIALFFPVGLLVGSARRGILVGAALSLAVEVAQFLTASGYSDIDDVMFNAAGAALGGWAATLASRGARETLLWAVAAGAAVLLLPFVAAAVV